MSITHNLTDQELATVLYALRNLQDDMHNDPVDTTGEMADSGHFKGLTPPSEDEIDDLCERLNLQPEPTAVPTIDKDQPEAIGWALDAAHADLESYLTNGSPFADYGDEWPEVCCTRAGYCRQIAAWTATIPLAGEVERWNKLADDFEQEAKSSTETTVEEAQAPQQ